MTPPNLNDHPNLNDTLNQWHPQMIPLNSMTTLILNDTPNLNDHPNSQWHPKSEWPP